MQLPQRVLVGALVVPALLAAVGLAAHPAPAGHLVVAVRSSEIVLAGTAGSAAERQEVVDAVRALSAGHRVTDVITPAAGERLPVAPDVARRCSARCSTGTSPTSPASSAKDT